MVRTLRILILGCALTEIKPTIEKRAKRLDNLGSKELSDRANDGDGQDSELLTRCWEMNTL